MSRLDYLPEIKYSSDQQPSYLLHHIVTFSPTRQWEVWLGMDVESNLFRVLLSLL